MTENGPRGCVIHSLGLFCGIETGIGVCVVAFKLLAGPETDIEGGNCCKLCHSRCNCYYIRVASKLITNITTANLRSFVRLFGSYFEELTIFICQPHASDLQAALSCLSYLSFRCLSQL